MPSEAALTQDFYDANVDAAAAQCALGVVRSLSGRSWRFREHDQEAARGLERTGLDAGFAQLLASRGVNADMVQTFLDPRLKTQLPEPYRFAHMERAALRFVDAVKAGEHIAVFGDYDVDGACSSALLLNFLRRIGGDALLYIPDRMTEGYGPSPGAMRALRERGASLVVTVDCGAAAHEALAAARDVGLDVIVLDHHAVEKNPPAFAHVNPNGPDDRSGVTYLCAAGLTFVFLVAVQRRLRQDAWFAANGASEANFLDQLDLVALATVADVVPLVGVNRAFVRQGLAKLHRLERPGFAALARLASSEPPFSAYHLGFIFGPRINAGGRVGRCDLGARLLASDDVTEADALALVLDRHNRERQAIERIILDSANDLAAAQADSRFVLVAGNGWHAGVVGIVAGRLKERYRKPVLVAGFNDDGATAVARGSARSVAGVDLGAIVRAAHEAGHLEGGGGHAMAAGFSVKRDKLAAFCDFVRNRLETQRPAIAAADDLFADGLVAASGATLELLAGLDRAGPYGAGNPEPVFLMPDMQVVYADIVGNNHVRLRLAARDGESIGAIAFRTADSPLGEALLKSRGRRLHVAGKLKRDDYGGKAKVQLHLEDAARAVA
jgi:single-stranded-DNA-specific exonuclease